MVPDKWTEVALWSHLTLQEELLGLGSGQDPEHLSHAIAALPVLTRDGPTWSQVPSTWGQGQGSFSEALGNSSC